jgi:predicted Zn-dependent protease
LGALLSRSQSRKALLELAKDLRDLGVTKADLCGLSLEFGPIPVQAKPLDAEDLVEMAKEAASKALAENDRIAMWSAS